MPNKRSAAKQMRRNTRRELYNRRHKTRVRTFEKQFTSLIHEQNKEEAAGVLQRANSALDRAAKIGAIPKERADRKKSRLASKLNTLS